jgi:hypothetical protein
MKQQVRLVALLALVMLPMGVMGQVTYNGNGNSGFGGVVGNGSVAFSDNGTDITFTFTRGSDSFNDVLVIYIDSKSGGFANTSTLNDQSDIHRKAISSFSSQVNFPTGFNADYAIAINRQFGAVWELAAGGNNSLPFQTTILGFDSDRSATLATYGGTFAKGNIGLSGNVEFRLFATYLNGGDGFLSNEGIGAGFPGSNVGQSSSLTVTSYWEYPVKNEINNTKTTSITNAAGWRLLSSPVSTTYADIVFEGWTQGSTGADVTNGSANVRTYSTAGGFANVADLGATAPAGQGFLYYHYNDDDFNGVVNAGPTTFSVTGTENASGTSFTPTWASGTQYAIAGNPFATTIDWDLVGKAAGVSATAWVYDRNISNYVSWNGTTGSLTDGLIAPFQGFFFEYTSAESAVTFETADKSNGGTFYRKEVNPFVVALEGASGEFKSAAYIEFDDSGEFGKGPKDALAFISLSPEHLTLSTISDGKSYSINHLPILHDELALPLDVQFTEGGTVDLSVTQLNLPSGWSATLHDNQTGQLHELTSDFSVDVVFSAQKSAPRDPLDLGGNPVMVAADSVTRFTLIIDPGTSTSTPDAGRSTPDAIALHGAYPNPFNPTTAIRFTLDAGRQTRLAVYDVLGREVTVLIDGPMPAGEHQATFDASTLTSGVYIVRLEAGGMSMTRRVTLLK